MESLRRDFTFGKNDNFIVFIDTYNDQTNGFAFGISPAGAQWDGLQANGGTVNLDWDIKWRSAVKNYDDRWVAEFAIPFEACVIMEEPRNGELISAGRILKPMKNQAGLLCQDSLQLPLWHIQVHWYGINHCHHQVPDFHLYLIYQQKQLRIKRQEKDSRPDANAGY